jgi:deoxycytidylate deaminase
MSSIKSPSLADQRPELVFALIGGTGTRLPDLEKELAQRLQNQQGYEPVHIRLSDLLKRFKGWTDPPGPSEYDRIKHLQNMGDAFRKELQRGDALALAGIAEIRARRIVFSKDPDKPALGHAYILHQLKHPAEVELLRKVYGGSFLFIAGHAPSSLRENELVEIFTKELARKEGAKDAALPQKVAELKAKASELISRDEKEDDDYGQNVRDAYPMADFFANLGINSGEWQVGRFIDLFFGHPFRSPQPDEYAMYLARATSLRSSDPSRQVGAVIIDNSENGQHTDIVAVGMNEVPRRGGGYPWDQDSPDSRDQMVEDRAQEIKTGVLKELIEKIADQQWLKNTIPAKSIDLTHELLPKLKGTQFQNIAEFSRPVHAEMAALIDAARRGVAVDGHSMYVTTFPCHNCVKHIIAAGIRRVIYLEPYPKSRAVYLYKEEINLQSVDGKDDGTGKVVFISFTGIAPRKYQQLFSMSERGSKSGNTKDEWEAKKSQHLLTPLYVPKNLLYLEAERQALKNLTPGIYPTS